VPWSWLTKIKEAGESTDHYHDREEAARHLEETCQGLEDGGLSRSACPTTSSFRFTFGGYPTETPERREPKTLVASPPRSR
jgi:hypothetical protein